MTHLINISDDNFVHTFFERSALYFTSDEKYKAGDKVIVQNDRTETEYNVSAMVGSIPSLKKANVMLILNEPIK